jgi:hypothetical protein
MQLYATRAMTKRRGGKMCPGIILLDAYKVHKQIEPFLCKYFRLWSNHIDGGLSYDLWALTQPVNSSGRITVCPLNK